MKQIAQVEIISANYLDVFKWLRKNMDWLNIKEAKEKSSQKIIDFDGDYEKAISMFNYLHNCMTNSARLIIDFSYDTRGAVGSYGVTIEQLEEDDKFRNEWEGKQNGA